jgi:hypothetical protein
MLTCSGRCWEAENCECRNEAHSSIKWGELINRLLRSPEGFCSVQTAHGTETLVFYVRRDSTHLHGLRQLQFSDSMTSDSTQGPRNVPMISSTDTAAMDQGSLSHLPFIPSVCSTPVTLINKTKWHTVVKASVTDRFQTELQSRK